MNRNVKEGLRWLDQAKMDVKTAKDCIKDGNFYASAFFAQQSAEKALEGFVFKGIEEVLKDGVEVLKDGVVIYGKSRKK